MSIVTRLNKEDKVNAIQTLIKYLIKNNICEMLSQDCYLLDVLENKLAEVELDSE